MIRRILFPLLFLVFSFQLFGQTSISGIINNYTKVLAFDACLNALQVEDNQGFIIGNKALLIQMQGAQIHSLDNSAFGSISDIGNAGNYELVEISSIDGNNIILTNLLINDYDWGQNGVQLISIPTYNVASVDDELIPQQWNGHTGGVIALQATQLILNADINASGKGFRGGEANINVNNDCSWLINHNNYYYGLNNWRGARKGEGIAKYISGRQAGRGKQANGGGGGNDHNSGGGGGANSGAGGDGGTNEEPSTFGCDGNFPGLGGLSLRSYEDKVFLGGGGGAGHENNGVGTNGGKGGGIVLIIADEIMGNGFSITANGEDAEEAQGDGAGGGGGGGTLLLDIEEYSSLFLATKGGYGGDQNNGGANRCMGPGAGGGGGAIYCSQTLNASLYDVEGGVAGISFNSSACGSSSNGASSGENGHFEELDSFIESNTLFDALSILNVPDSLLLCAGTDGVISLEFSGDATNFQWQIDTPNAFEDIVDNGVFSGAQSANLNIAPVEMDLEGRSIRLVVSNDCGITVESDAIELQVEALPEPMFGISVNDMSIQLTNISQFGSSYFWGFGDGNNSTVFEPIHLYNMAGTFNVSLSAINDCDTVTISQEVLIQGLPVAGFTISEDTICIGESVNYTNTSTGGYTGQEWNFSGGTPAVSYFEHPEITYWSAGQFGTTLQVGNSRGQDSITIFNAVSVIDLPEAGFSMVINDLAVDFISESTLAESFIWDFGDGSSSISENPMHTYAEAGFYTVSLLVVGACGQDVYIEEIQVGTAPVSAFTSSASSGCGSIEVQFFNDSYGNYNHIEWSFPGGTPSTSTQENPIIQYDVPGTYDVSLVIQGALGTDSDYRGHWVNVYEYPTAAFEYTLDADNNQVNFNNESFNASSYFWDFGDGTSSTENSPVHTYSESGIYTVTLNASNGVCGSSSSSIIYLVTSWEDLKEKGWNIYPNPVGDWLTISAIDHSEFRVEILDAAGRLLGEYNSNGHLQVDFSDKINAWYYLNIITAKGSDVVKIVKGK